MLQRIKAFVRDSKAVAALEYAILIGIVVVGVGAAIITLSDGIDAEIDRAKTAINKITEE